MPRAVKTLVSVLLAVLILGACKQKTTEQPTTMGEENLFNVGDVLVFQYPDQSYGLTILLEITRSEEIPGFPIPNVHDYDFCRTTFKSAQQPTMADIMNAQLIGYDVKQGMWGSGTQTVFYTYVVSHGCLKEYADCFHKIGTLGMDNLNGRVGATTGAPDFRAFCKGFAEYEKYNNQWNEYTVKTYTLQRFVE